MKALLTFVLALLAVTLRAANPSFGSFNANDFQTDGKGIIQFSNNAQARADLGLGTAATNAASAFLTTNGVTLVNVTNFGAKCDGTNDDTSAWNAALATGGVLQPPNTVSMVSSQLVIPSFRLVQGMPGAILRRIPGTGMPTSNVLNNTDFFVNSGESNGTTNADIIVAGFTFDGLCDQQTAIVHPNSQPYMGQIALRFFHVNGITVKDCVFTNIPLYQTQFADCTGVVIENCQFWCSGTNRSQDCIHFNGPDSHVRVENILAVSNSTVVLAVNANDDTDGLLSTGNINDVIYRNLTRAGVPALDDAGSHVQILNSTYSITDVHGSGLYGTNGFDGMLIMTQNEGAPSGLISSVTLDGFNVTGLYSNSPLIAAQLSIDALTISHGTWNCGSGSNSSGASSGGFGQNILNYQGGTLAHVLLEDVTVNGHVGHNWFAANNKSDAPISVAGRYSGSLSELNLAHVVVNQNVLTAGFPVIDDSYYVGGDITSINISGLLGNGFDTLGVYVPTFPTFGLMSDIQLSAGDWRAGLALTERAGFGSLTSTTATIVTNQVANQYSGSATVTNAGASAVVVTDAAHNLTNSSVTAAQLANMVTGVVPPAGYTAVTNSGVITFAPLGTFIGTTNTTNVNLAGGTNSWMLPMFGQTQTYFVSNGAVGQSYAMIFGITNSCTYSFAVPSGYYLRGTAGLYTNQPATNSHSIVTLYVYADDLGHTNYDFNWLDNQK